MTSVPQFQPSQQDAPLLQCLQSLTQRDRAAFHTPGHKQGQGASTALIGLLGDRALQADLPELPELDNLFSPSGVIQQAQQLASEAFGAAQTWFLANGSTCGIEAAILAICNPGEKLVVPRNAHQSVISALILSGAIPIWVEPDYSSDWLIATSLPLARVEAALKQHPDAKAVLVVSPTYHGICSDVAGIVAIAHSRDLPVLVDEAHGAHFAFHPDLPPTALSAGADLTVQSIHKTLSALTQAAMLHVQGNRIDADRLSQALQLVQSTSPNYLLLASLDAARQQMATQGAVLMQQTLTLAEQARLQINQIPGLTVLTIDHLTSNCPIDPTRLTIDVSGLGLTGFAADEILHQEFGVTAELPALSTLTFIFTPGNSIADFDRLVAALRALSAKQSDPSREAIQPAARQPEYQASLAGSITASETLMISEPVSPRTAFFAPKQTVLVAEAIGRCSAELICPYPPGIPVLFPGEVITTAAVQFLQQVLVSGGVLSGCADSDLVTLKVICS